MATTGSLCRHLIFLLILGAFQSAAQDPPNRDEPIGFGVVIEKVGSPSAPERACLQPGDLLLNWERLPNDHSEGEKGSFKTVFTWFVFLVEQTPRGVIRLFGERDGAKRTFEVPLGDWTGVEARPVLPPDALTLYLKGKEYRATGNAETGVAQWQALLQNRTLPRKVSCWLQIQIGKVWTEEHEWQRANAALDKAMKLADGPWSQIAVWEAIAEARQKQNQFEEAAEAYKVQAKKWKLGKGEKLGFSKSLESIGILKLNQGELNHSEKEFQAALKVRERLAPGSLAVASSHHNLGVLAWKRGNINEADSFYKQALVIREYLAPGSLDLASSLNNIGNIAALRSDFAASTSNYRKAFEITKKLKPDSLVLATIINNLGVVALKEGDQDAALALYKEALTIREKLKPGSHYVASSLNNLAIVAKQCGDYVSAFKLYKRSLAIWEEVAPGNPEITNCLTGLGSLARLRGDYSSALKYQKRALNIQESIDPNSVNTAAILHNLGTLAWNRGYFNAALHYHIRALKIREKELPKSLYVASSLTNLGSVNRAMGNQDAALYYFQRALDLEEALAPDGTHLAYTLNSMGVVSQDRGDLTAALYYFQRALAIWENKGSKNVQMANVLSNLGGMAYDRGDYGSATAYYQDSLVILENIASGSIEEAHTLNGLAKTKNRMGQVNNAEIYFERSIQALEAQLGRIGGSDHIKAEFKGQHEDYYREYIEFTVLNNKLVTAFDMFERTKAKILHQMIFERDLLFIGKNVREELERARIRITYQYEKIQAELNSCNLTEDDQRIVELRGTLIGLRQEYEDVIEETRKSSPRLASLRAPNPLVLAEVQQMLDPDTVMLSYCVTKDKTFLFIVRKREGLAVHTIEKGEPYFRDRVRELQRVIRDPGSRVAGRLLKGLCIELFNELIAPAKDQIEDSQWLVILPDGPLHKLPFNLLLEERGGEPRYLIEWKPITTAVSSTIYAELKNRPKRDQLQIAAFGDPVYPTFPRPASNRVAVTTRGAISFLEDPVPDPDLSGFLRDNPNELLPLPYTAQEVGAIARAYPNQTRLYLKREASEQNVKALGTEPGIIHFACHGWVNDRFPLESALAFTIPDSFEEGEENGILQAWEIFDGLRIDADLVVLSACETGLGKTQGTEGLTGLTRAFQFAGARSIIASYWNVEDQATAALMSRFYRYLKEGKNKSEALRQAQIDLIRNPLKSEQPYLFGLLKRTINRDVSHPFYWAAFQLIGPWD